VTTASAPAIGGLRQRGAERFARLGFPTTRNEDWKFTSVAPIAQAGWPAARMPVVEPPAAGLDRFRLGVPACELVFLNGRYAPDLSQTGDLPDGVIVASLARMLETNPERVLPCLGTIADHERQAFTALNTSQIVDGAFIEVPRGTVLAMPIHLLYLSDASVAPFSSHPRNLILAGESSDLTVFESFAALRDSAYFTNAVTEIAVGANARVEHLKFQRESEHAFHVGTVAVRQARDSRFRSFSFALGGLLARTNIYSVMQEEGADCTMNGLYLLHENQHIDHQTRIEHAAPNCTSREVYKGILDGNSHAVFNGKVFVRPEAQKTDGKQTNKNLLLSDGAKVDTKPQLEIYADDVKCTHGATVGRLDEIGLFYLESRGIGAGLARRLLTYGFAAEVLGEINPEAIRHRLERLVFDRLEFAMQ
jgi:Fe-S cluster assembly protein SufD